MVQSVGGFGKRHEKVERLPQPMSKKNLQRIFGLSHFDMKLNIFHCNTNGLYCYTRDFVPTHQRLCNTRQETLYHYTSFVPPHHKILYYDIKAFVAFHKRLRITLPETLYHLPKEFLPRNKLQNRRNTTSIKFDMPYNF